MTESRELGPLMLADGWRCVGGENLCWFESGGSVNSRVVTICESRYLFGQILQGNRHRSGFTVTLLTIGAEGFPCSELYHWAESYAVALRFALNLRAAVLGGAAALRTQLT